MTLPKFLPVVRVTSDVTFTEQQTTARNPVPVLPMSELNLTVMVLLLVKGPGRGQGRPQ